MDNVLCILRQKKFLTSHSPILDGWLGHSIKSKISSLVWDIFNSKCKASHQSHLKLCKIVSIISYQTKQAMSSANLIIFMWQLYPEIGIYIARDIECYQCPKIIQHIIWCAIPLPYRLPLRKLKHWSIHLVLNLNENALSVCQPALVGGKMLMD